MAGSYILVDVKRPKLVRAGTVDEQPGLSWVTVSSEIGNLDVTFDTLADLDAWSKELRRVVKAKVAEVKAAGRWVAPVAAPDAETVAS